MKYDKNALIKIFGMSPKVSDQEAEMYSFQIHNEKFHVNFSLSTFENYICLRMWHDDYQCDFYDLCLEDVTSIHTFEDRVEIQYLNAVALFFLKPCFSIVLEVKKESSSCKQLIYKEDDLVELFGAFPIVNNPAEEIYIARCDGLKFTYLLSKKDNKAQIILFYDDYDRPLYSLNFYGAERLVVAQEKLEFIFKSILSHSINDPNIPKIIVNFKGNFNLELENIL